MKRLFILIGIFCFLFQNTEVYASECTSQEIDKYKALANVIQISTEFDKASVDFGIYGNNIVTIQGMDKELYILSKDETEGFFHDDMIDGVINATIPSGVDTLYVYASKCPSEKLRTIKLSLKKYNYYADYKECEGISGEELDVCDEYYGSSISYEEFLKEIENYKKRNNKLTADEANDFLGKYGIYIVISISLFVILVIIFIIRKIKRGRLD